MARRYVCATAGLALAAAVFFLAPDGWRPDLRGAHHIRRTTIVQAGGPRLANLFEGVPVDPTFERLRRSAPPAPCRNREKTGWIGRLLALAETVVHAQSGSCNAYNEGLVCLGRNEAPGPQVDCVSPCSDKRNTIVSDSDQRYDRQGYKYIGGCGGPGTCTTDQGNCSLDVCPVQAGCSNDSQCAPLFCDTSTGTCVQCNANHACPGQGLPGGCEYCGNGTCYGNDNLCNGCQGCNMDTGYCEDYDEFCPEYSNCGGDGDYCSGGCCVECQGPCDCGDSGCQACDIATHTCQDDHPFCFCDAGGGGGGKDSCSENSECESGCCSYGVCTRPGAPQPECNGGYDPIIVDLSGAGFSLTNPQHGVKFDFFGTRNPKQMAWTAAGARIGWLALDRDGDGRIESGAELFSNVTPQPDPGTAVKLGFRALAVYDLHANGGNGDGVIDHRDAVFSKLLVWVDANHNGISEKSELVTLQQAGVQSISLHYEQSRWKDAYGNQFRYRSKIAFAGDVPASDRYVYDVILVGR